MKHQELMPTVKIAYQRALSRTATLRHAGLMLLACLFLASCEQSRIKQSREHFLQPTNPPLEIAATPAPTKEGGVIATPSAEGTAPPHEEVYTITVTEMPVRDLLFALARDANKNIDVYPGIQGRVTLSAIDQPLTKILDRVAKQVGIRYEIQDKTIVVTPDLPFLKIYQVDYLGIERNMVSTNKISTNLSTQKANKTSFVSSAQPDANQTNTVLTTTSDSKFWKSLIQNVQAILGADTGSDVPLLQDVATPGVGAVGTGGGVGGLDALMIPAGAPSGMGAPSGGKTMEGKTQQGNRPGLVSVNVEAGVISIIATAAQHERIQDYLDSVLENVHRQVLIESTVVEVELSDRFQEGVNWEMIFNNRIKGAVNNAVNQLPATGGLLSFALGSGADLPASFSADNKAKGPVFATVKMLETFGNTKVLSSPKIMALNNQPAVLKVVKNRVFFTLKSSTTAPENATTPPTAATQPVFDTEIHTVPEGLIITVTPQISSEGIVSMNVRPTITRITSYQSDPNPALKGGNLQTGLQADIQNLIPEIEIKEMETLMRVHSGQVAVMGGLMQDTVEKDTNGLPVLSKLPGPLGSMFGSKDQQVRKSELVIFLRPVVMTHGKPRTERVNRPVEPTKESAQSAPATPKPPVAASPAAPSDKVTGGAKPADKTGKGKTVSTDGEKKTPAPAKPAPVAAATPGANPAAAPTPTPTSAPASALAPTPLTSAPPAAPASPSAAQTPVPAPVAPQPAASAPAAPPPAGVNAMSVGSYLDFTSAEGLANISRQTRIPPPTPEPPAHAPAPPPGPEAAMRPPQRFYLDLGSYRDTAFVEEIRKQVAAIGLPILPEQTMQGGQTVTRLRSGPFPGQREATDALARLNDATELQARLVTD
ncbi:MAG: pilus (MSHA type) biogenesis protein MshL [Magnetococcales bacterium]|nr:pilus (MSHA type) biogenesis protein MshL [Magnetococcales bacterium]